MDLVLVLNSLYTVLFNLDYINTDDKMSSFVKVLCSCYKPSLFHTDMNNEYIQLHQQLGFTVPELFQISLNGTDAAFLDEEIKSQLRSSFLSEYDQIIE